KGADLETFEPLGRGYARDCARVYFEKSRIARAHPPTFELLNAWFGRDRARVFYLHHAIDGALRDSFEVVMGMCARDAARVYLAAMPIAAADPSTFTCVDADFIGKDARRVFVHGQVL